MKVPVQVKVPVKVQVSVQIKVKRGKERKRESALQRCQLCSSALSAVLFSAAVEKRGGEQEGEHHAHCAHTAHAHTHTPCGLTYKLLILS